MILLGLNELNAHYIKEYISAGKLKNFKDLFSRGLIETNSETQYELLEPWIQWTTVHTGKSYSEHKVFRLGDITDRDDLTQIFEDLESQGLSIGAVSPFNAANRLNHAKFFIPDPWTQTKSSGGFFISKLSQALSRIVNSNSSGKAQFSDILWLFIGFFAYVRKKRWLKFFLLGLKLKKPGVKAAILDCILTEIFVTLQKKKNPDYSHIFLNAGAHIQHHYLFNSKFYDGPHINPEWYCAGGWDPLLMILETYDQIIGDLLLTGEKIVGLTGLSQTPHEKQTFYWRPIKHNEFLRELGVSGNFKVVPRMSRDFLIQSKSKDHLLEIEKLLGSYVDSIENKPVFVIDNRGDSLFIELVYDKNISGDLEIINESNRISNLKNKLVFVAIKNGHHDPKGFLFANFDMDIPASIDLKETYKFIRKIAIEDAGKKL